MQNNVRGLAALTLLTLSFLSFAMELLPEPAFAIFGGKPQGDTPRFCFALGGITAIAGMFAFWRARTRYPDEVNIAKSLRQLTPVLGLILLLFLISAVLSLTTGLSPAELKGRTTTFMGYVFVVVLILLGLLVAYALWLSWFSPNSKMSRLMQQERWEEAIAIGEIEVGKKADLVTVYNLVSAYQSAGRLKKARKLAPKLQEILADYPHTLDDETQQTIQSTIADLAK